MIDTIAITKIAFIFKHFKTYSVVINTTKMLHSTITIFWHNSGTFLVITRLKIQYFFNVRIIITHNTLSQRVSNFSFWFLNKSY